MPQALWGITKPRVVPPAMAGPPNGPLALRVSAIRHGDMGTNRDGAEFPLALREYPTTSRTSISAVGEMSGPATPRQPAAFCTSGVRQFGAQSPASSLLMFKLLYCCSMLTPSIEKQALAVLGAAQGRLSPAAELRLPSP